MRIAVGADEHLPIVDVIVDHLIATGHDPVVISDGEPWPEVGRAVAEAVVGGDSDAGIVCCWTGTGVSIAANKVAGCRAALCTDGETARGARRWNDANVLAIGMRLTSAELAREIVDAFLAGEMDDGEADTVARVEGHP